MERVGREVEIFIYVNVLLKEIYFNGINQIAHIGFYRYGYFEEH